MQVVVHFCFFIDFLLIFFFFLILGEILEVLHTGCAKCTEKTKTRLKKTFLRLKSDPRFRGSYKKVLDKYDPHKKYIVNLEKFLT